MAQQWLCLSAIVVSAPVVVLVCSMIHELGHVLAALSVGYRVRGVIVGRAGFDRDGSRTDFFASGKFFRFRWMSGGGATIFSPQQGWIWGWRGIVAYSGGIAMNFVALAFALPDGLGFARCGISRESCAATIGNGPLPARGMLAQPDLVAYVGAVFVLFCVANIVQGVGNLWPRVYVSGTVTDGRRILNLIRAQRLVEWIQVAEASAIVERPRAEVWKFVDDPANVHRYDETIARAYQKPGTPAGEGRIVVSELRPTVPGTQGQVVESEIIAFEPPRRVMLRISAHSSLRAEMLLRTAGPGATRLTQTVWIGAKPTLVPDQRQRMIDGFRGTSEKLGREVEAIRSLLEPEHRHDRLDEHTRMTQAIRVRRNTRARARRQS